MPDAPVPAPAPHTSLLHTLANDLHAIAERVETTAESVMHSATAEKVVAALTPELEAELARLAPIIVAMISATAGDFLPAAAKALVEAEAPAAIASLVQKALGASAPAVVPVA